MKCRENKGEVGQIFKGSSISSKESTLNSPIMTELNKTTLEGLYSNKKSVSGVKVQYKTFSWIKKVEDSHSKVEGLAKHKL